jgi:hypothetical protein
MNSEIVQRLEKSFEKDDLTALVTTAARAAADAVAYDAAEKVELVMYAIFRQLAESKKLLLSEDEREELLVRESLLATAPRHFKAPTREAVSDNILEPASAERKSKAST